VFRKIPKNLMKRPVLKPIQFVVLIILICCLQSAAWATAGFAEWEISTPGGNKIGNNDGLPAEVKGAAIYNGEIHPNDNSSRIYVDLVGKYGFYDGAIIGETHNQFFLFDESTKAVTKFSTKAALCSDVKAKDLKFNNNLKFFNGSYPYDYYVIRYALYFLIPFALLLIAYSITKWQVPLPLRINQTLNSVSFPLLQWGLSTLTFYSFTVTRTSDGWDLWIFTLLFVGILIGSVGGFSWIFSLLILRMFDRILRDRKVLNSAFFALLKCAIVAGIIFTGLFLTISPLASSWTNIRYFSCVDTF
jgi:hypothetical protein